MLKDSKKAQFTREFSTPPPPQSKGSSGRMMQWQSAPSTPLLSEKKKNKSPLPQQPPPPRPPPSSIPDSFHIVHKVPTGDSPYVKAKHVQLVDRDPSKAISLFWSAINAGDRVDSALKDMAIVMKQLNRTDEAIEAIKSFRHLCTSQAQESLDNVLIDLYKRGGRIDEHIELLQYKLRLIDEGVAFNGKRTKVARSQGKKFHVSIDQERARLLGNLAWAYMQQSNYKAAEELYRKALSIEPDKNKQCNLAICLMNEGRITEAKSLLEAVRPSSTERETADSYIKSFDRALENLTEIEAQLVVKPQDNGDQSHGFGFSVCRKWEDKSDKVPQGSSNYSVVKQERGSYSPNQIDYGTDSLGFDQKPRWGVERRSFGQFSRLPPDNRKDIRCSQSLLEEGFGFSCSKNEDLINVSRTEYSGPSRKNVRTEVKTFESPVSIYRNSKLKSTEPNCSESYSEDWRRGGLWGDKNEDLVSESRMECSGPSRKNMTTDVKIFESPVSIYRNSKPKSTEPNREDWRRDGSWGDKNGHLVSESRTECSGPSRKNMSTDANAFESPVSIYRNSKLKSTEPNWSESYREDWRSGGSWGDKKEADIHGCIKSHIHNKSAKTAQDWRRGGSCGDKKEADMHGCIKSHIHMKSPKTGDHLGAMESQKLGGGGLQGFDSSPGWNKKSEVIVSDSVSVIGNIQEEAHSVKDDCTATGLSTVNNGPSYKKSWADMVEEEEELLRECSDIPMDDYLSQKCSSTSFQTPSKWGNRWYDDNEDTFHNENADSNIISPTPSRPLSSFSRLITSQARPSPKKELTENLAQKLQHADLKDGERYNRSIDNYSFKSSTTRRVLSFDQQEHKAPHADKYCPSPLRKKANDFEEYNCAPVMGRRSKDSESVRRGGNRRLKVFQDITLQDSPRA